VKQPLDTEAAQRVLRRAHDIAAAHGLDADHAVEVGVGVSPQALVDAAEEVGIDPGAVRDALALDLFDAGAPEPQSLDRIAGAGAVAVEDVVRRSAVEALDAAEDWLTVAHRMRCVRGPSGDLDCRPRSGLAASMGRAVNGISGEVNIQAVERLSVSAQPLEVDATPDDPRTLLRIIADRRTSRRRRLGVGTVAGATGVGVSSAGVVAGVITGTAVLVAAPVVGVPLIVGGYLAARSGRRHADEVELEVMRVLAAIDRDEPPVGLVGRAARRARKAVSTSGTDS